MDNEESFLSVLLNTNIENILSPSETLTIQAKLWDILAGRTESFMMGGSSSIRVETAQELLRSACFVIGYGFRHNLGYSMETSAGPESMKAHLLTHDFDTLFRAGLEAIKIQVHEGEGLLETAVWTASAVDNSAYRDTLRELGVFFKRYHYHHFAHQIPCMIDYPLAQSADEALLGIDYINDYLRRLIIENEFCGHFETDTIISLLRSISPDYKNNLLNIFEAVAANALALTLLKSDARSLDITQNDREKLFTLISSWQEKRVTSELQAASSALCSFLDITDCAAIDYFSQTISSLQPRLQQSLKTKKLNSIFPSLYREPENKKPAVSYIDGPLMDDEALRMLIGEISSCRYVSDKIALARQNIHSLRDYIEILNICFWDEECIVLFDSLSNEELKHLRLALKQKQSKSPEWTSETGWENYLMDYVKGK